MPQRSLQGGIHGVLNNEDKGIQVRFRDLTSPYLTNIKAINQAMLANSSNYTCMFGVIHQYNAD